MGNIAHLLSNFIRCSEYENIIFCWVLYEQAILDDLLGRIDAQNCALYCLSAYSGPQIENHVEC